MTVKGIRLRAAMVWATAIVFAGPAVAAAPAQAATHTVTYDHYSLKIDGKRVYLWSASFTTAGCPAPTSGATCCRR